KRCQVDQAVSGEPEFERLVVFRHAQPDKAAAEDERAEPGEPRRPRSGEQQIHDDAAVASAPGGAMSENGRLRHDEGTQGSGARRRRVLELLTLWSSAGTTSSAMNPIDVNTMMSFRPGRFSAAGAPRTRRACSVRSTATSDRVGVRGGRPR